MDDCKNTIVAVIAVFVVLICGGSGNSKVAETFTDQGGGVEDGEIAREPGCGSPCRAAGPQIVSIDRTLAPVINPKHYDFLFYETGDVAPQRFANPIRENFPRPPYVLLGAILVAVHGRLRFNRWTEKNRGRYVFAPRFYMPWGRFVRSLAVYVLMTEFAYLAVLMIPGAVALINRNLASQPSLEAVLRQVGQYGGLWAVLLVTCVLPNFPGIKRCERKVREALQQCAMTSYEAGTVSCPPEANCRVREPEPKIIEDVLAILANAHCEESYRMRHEGGEGCPPS